MRNLEQLLNDDEPAIHLINEWIAAAVVPAEILPPSPRRADVLVSLQITTRSPLGALAYDTGGALVDHGWLRFLGSGHERLGRDLQGWNSGRSQDFLLFADDAVGGFFALNGGAFGPDLGKVYYWPPDDLDWMSLEMTFSDFFEWSLSARLAQFYEDLRWPGWELDVASLPADRCFGFYPYLWTAEGSVEGSHRATIPCTEAFDVKMHIVKQLNQ
jgi:hypothetical protein